MRKLLSITVKLFLIIGVVSSPVFAYNPNSGVGTLNGVNYWDDGNSAPVKLTYSYNNDTNYSLWEAQSKTWVPNETQGVISRTFYRSADVVSFNWINKHTDSVSSSSGCGSDHNGNACQCNRDTYTYTQEQATEAVRNNEYYDISTYTWKESWSVQGDGTCTSWGCPGNTVTSAHGTWTSASDCAASFPSCTGSTTLNWHYDDLLPYYSCKDCAQATSCLDGAGKSECPGTCRAVQCYRSSCNYQPEGQISVSCKQCFGKSENKTAYYYGTIERHAAIGWSAWSSWTDSPIQETNKRKVETITLYSYPITEQWTYDAFARGDEDINFGQYTADDTTFLWGYVPDSYNMRNYIYYYVPAIKVCRVQSNTGLYQTQQKLQAWINDTAPTVKAGTNVELSVQLFGGTAQGYQWQSRADVTGTWKNISGATSRTYSFTAQAADNGKEFRCVVTGASNNEAVNATAESNPATVIILN